MISARERGEATFSFLAARPALAAALGAGWIATSGVLVRLADTTPATVAFFRCLYALPFLGALALLERRRMGPLPARTRRLTWMAGVFFALDLVLWHHAIAAVGAGLATVLGNLQVLLVGFAAWAILGERPHRGMAVAIPLVVTGVVLISGLVGEGAYGRDPALGVLFGIGTSIAYAGFILVLRQGARDLRRPAAPLFHATFVAAVAAAVYGGLAGELHPVPTWPSHGWLALLALAAQVVGWLLISVSLPRLPAAVTSVLLLLQPVGAMALAAAVLDEAPSAAQLGGAVLILIGVVISSATARRRSPEVNTLPGAPPAPEPEEAEAAPARAGQTAEG